MGSSPKDAGRSYRTSATNCTTSIFWDAWLLLEESSAEKIVRSYLIPWFVPSLQSRLRTYSAHSLSEVPTKFSDFNDLLVFLHLEPVYKNRAWVVVDGGTSEMEVIRKLREMYEKSGWKGDHFSQAEGT